MDRDGANLLLKKLQAYYPRVYSSNIDQEKGKLIVDDFCQVFKDFPNDAVINALYKWHTQQTSAPSIAELLPMAMGFVKVDDRVKAETFSNPIEDDDGYVYAVSSRTNDYVCVWKPEWANEDFAERVRKGTHSKGMGNPNWIRKYKVEELRKRGLVK